MKQQNTNEKMTAYGAITGGSRPVLTYLPHTTTLAGSLEVELDYARDGDLATCLLLLNREIERGGSLFQRSLCLFDFFQMLSFFDCCFTQTLTRKVACFCLDFEDLLFLSTLDSHIEHDRACRSRGTNGRCRFQGLLSVA